MPPKTQAIPAKTGLLIGIILVALTLLGVGIWLLVTLLNNSDSSDSSDSPSFPTLVVEPGRLGYINLIDKPDPTQVYNIKVYIDVDTESPDPLPTNGVYADISNGAKQLVFKQPVMLVKGENVISAQGGSVNDPTMPISLRITNLSETPLQVNIVEVDMTTNEQELLTLTWNACEGDRCYDRQFYYQDNPYNWPTDIVHPSLEYFALVFPAGTYTIINSKGFTEQPMRPGLGTSQDNVLVWLADTEVQGNWNVELFNKFTLTEPTTLFPWFVGMDGEYQADDWIQFTIIMT